MAAGDVEDEWELPQLLDDDEDEEDDAVDEGEEAAERELRAGDANNNVEVDRAIAEFWERAAARGGIGRRHMANNSNMYFVSTFDHGLSDEVIVERLHLAAHYGRCNVFIALLMRKTDAQREFLLNSGYADNSGQKTPALCEAAFRGQLSVVKLLVELFEVDVSVTGAVKYGNYMINGASALWLASGRGHFEIVKYLVQNRARVNQTTLTNSTPLRAACYDGRLEVTRFLLENGGDLNIANKYDNTCLMIASYRGHDQIVKLLLEKGADPNRTSSTNISAIHFAAEQENVEVARHLMAYGARWRDDCPDHALPVMIAAINGKEAMVQFFQECTGYLNREVHINSLELLAASFTVERQVNYTKVFSYLHRAMHLRFPGPPFEDLPKKIGSPLPEYDNRTESANLEELEEIRHVPELLQIEALMIYERVLGLDHPDLWHPIIYRGAFYAGSLQFNKCVALWLRVIQLKQRTRRCVVRDIWRFLQVFSQMLELAETIPFASYMEFLRACIYQLGIRGSTSNPRVQPEELMKYISMALCLGAKLTRSAMSEKQRFQFKSLVHSQIVIPDYRDIEQNSLLHYAVSEKTKIKIEMVDNCCYFPSSVVTELLLECGADPNWMNGRGETALHTIGYHRQPVHDGFAMMCIINLLAENGCHLDSCDAMGHSPAQTCVSGVADVLIRSVGHRITLKCLASRAICKYNIRFENTVPKSLIPYVRLHFPNGRPPSVINQPARLSSFWAN